MGITKGVFLSDIHLPDNISLGPIKAYLKDYQPDIIILGGDIIDAKGMHGVDSMAAGDVDIRNYTRDCRLLHEFITDLAFICPKAQFVFLEGNHEERYQRLARKYPKCFRDVFDIPRDAFPNGPKIEWIPYGGYQSFYTIGDMMFIHGTIWPDNHAKAYALRHTPYKVCYGHLHHFQAYTTHRANPSMSPRYAVTAGCLSKLDPDWKKGTAHQWTNGFVSFISDHGTTIPTVHQIEKGMFAVGAKVYK